MNSSFLYHAWGLYQHNCLREEYKDNTIILHIESNSGIGNSALIFPLRFFDFWETVLHVNNIDKVNFTAFFLYPLS